MEVQTGPALAYSLKEALAQPLTYRGTILSDPELLAALREADAEVVAGATIPLSKQEALAELEQ